MQGYHSNLSTAVCYPTFYLIDKGQGLIPPDDTDQEKLQAIAAVLTLPRKGIGHEYLTWQAETVSERGYLLESQHLPPPLPITFILLIQFSAEDLCFITQ